MNRLWWGLPGPRRFISQITQDLRNGKNVLVWLPEYCLPANDVGELEQALRDALDDDTVGTWTPLVLEDDQQADPPESILWNNFGSGAFPGLLRTLDMLMTADRFMGRVVCLQNVGPIAWIEWARFLTDYQHRCQTIGLLGRTVFCIAFNAAHAPSHDVPPEDTCLVHRYWQRVVERLDMLLYASYLVSDNLNSYLERQISISVIANLAQWDPIVCEYLAQEELDTLLAPHSLLCDIATSRGWHPDTGLCAATLWLKEIEEAPDAIDLWYRGGRSGVRAPESWSRGLVDVVDGQKKLHSAALAGRDTKEEISRRIWSGQVRELLPFVEEVRQRFLSSLGSALIAPHCVRRDGKVVAVIDHRDDLEIGHIANQLALARNKTTAAETKRLSQHLAVIRNKVAHSEQIDAHMLQCEQMTDLFIERAVMRQQ